ARSAARPRPRHPRRRRVVPAHRRAARGLDRCAVHRRARRGRRRHRPEGHPRAGAQRDRPHAAARRARPAQRRRARDGPGHRRGGHPRAAPRARAARRPARRRRGPAVRRLGRRGRHGPCRAHLDARRLGRVVAHMTLVHPDERRFTGVSMRRRLARLLGAVAAMLVIALAVAVLALVQSRGLDARADGPYYRALVDGERASLALSDADASLRAYRATCEPAALEPWTRAVGSSGRIQLLADVERRELAADAEVILAHEEAARRTDAWFREYAEPLVAAVGDTGAGEARCRLALADAPTAAEGEALYESARTAVVRYLAELSAQRDAIVGTRAVWERLLLGAVATLVLVVVLMGTLMWLALEGWVIRPLTELTAAVRVVSSGGIRREIRPAGTGEVALLAMHVETMRRDLVHQVEEIRLSHQEVENAHALLSEKTRELERSNRDLEQFAYVASHDLQEPLRKVASFTQLLRKRYGGQIDERADQYIEFAVDGAKRMQGLIQDLLAFSRVGRTGVPREDVDLESVLSAALTELSDRIDETGAEIEHDPMPEVHG